MQNLLKKEDLINEIRKFTTIPFVIEKSKYKNDLSSQFLRFLDNSLDYHLCLEDLCYLNFIYSPCEQYKIIALEKMIVLYKDFEVTKFLKNKSDDFIYYFLLLNTDVILDKKEVLDIIKFFKSTSYSLGQSKIKTQLKDMSTLKNKTSNILDFISSIVFKNKITEKEFLDFINIEKNENLISYLDEISISFFINICFSYINAIGSQEKIQIDNKFPPKHNYFYSVFIKFLKNLNDDILDKAYKYTGYLNILIDRNIKSKISLDEQANSHYIQAAYLKRIMGERVILEGKDIEINHNGTNHNNPYCRPYFYGNSIPETSIEKEFKHVENDFIPYLEQIEKIINKDIAENTFFNNKKLTFKEEHNLIFLLNYIRTPHFLDHLNSGYRYYSERDSFNKNTIISLASNQEKDNYLNFFSYQTLKNTTITQRINFFKVLQYSLITYFVDIIKNDNKICPNKFITDIIDVYLKKYPIYSGDFVENDQNWDFLIMVLEKFKKFIFVDEYDYFITAFDFTQFSYNLFIPRATNFNRENEEFSNEIFSNESPILCGYYPQSKNKLIYFVKKQDTNLTNWYNDYPFELSKENLMLKMNHLPFIVSIKIDKI